MIDAASAPCVLQMIPSSHQRRDQDQVQLVTTMRSLVLDQQHPIALEIAGTDQQRSLLIRARNHDDLCHVETQLHARLPHARFVPLTGRNDPFHLSPGETVSVVELHAGQASYLPLQEFDHGSKGEDPILGILGALDALPSDLRAIAQIALVPASPTWSQPYQRKALEHALEPERQQDRQKQVASRGDAGAPSTVLLVMGALFLSWLLSLPILSKSDASMGTNYVSSTARWQMATSPVRATSPGSGRNYRCLDAGSSDTIGAPTHLEKSVSGTNV